MSLRENFTNTISMIHTNQNKSLTEFADELCISRSSLQEILKGNSNPTLDTVEHIAKQLGFDPLALLSYSKEQLHVMLFLSMFMEQLLTLPDEKKTSLSTALDTILQIVSDIK